MGHKILICGGNGAGKTTLARALAKRSGYMFVDVEEYYFPQRVDGYAYGQSRAKEEVEALLLADLERYADFIFTSVKGDFTQEVLERFTCAVLVSVPKSRRMQRVRERSRQKFGDRMLPGGDLHDQEEAFFRMVENRPEKETEAWLAACGLPALRVDGTQPPEKNAEKVMAYLLPDTYSRPT